MGEEAGEDMTEDEEAEVGTATWPQADLTDFHVTPASTPLGCRSEKGPHFEPGQDARRRGNAHKPDTMLLIQQSSEGLGQAIPELACGGGRVHGEQLLLLGPGIHPAIPLPSHLCWPPRHCV